MNAREFFSILRQINISNSKLHAQHMRGAADVAIFEGKKSIEFLRMLSPMEFPPHFLTNPNNERWIQVVVKGEQQVGGKLYDIHFPKSRITLIKYSGYGGFYFPPKKNEHDIPQIESVTFDEPQPDFVDVIDIDTLVLDEWGTDSWYEADYARLYGITEKTTTCRHCGDVIYLNEDGVWEHMPNVDIRPIRSKWCRFDMSRISDTVATPSVFQHTSEFTKNRPY